MIHERYCERVVLSRSIIINPFPSPGIFARRAPAPAHTPSAAVRAPLGLRPRPRVFLNRHGPLSMAASGD